MCVCAIETAPVVNLENGGGGRVASRESVGERRRSSVTQDLTEYTYSVAEEPDAEVADDDDVFEMEAGGGGGEQTAPGNGSAGGGATSEAKRRTQSLGSLTGEPKSPRKVLNVAYVNNLKLLLFFFCFLFFVVRPALSSFHSQIIYQYRSERIYSTKTFLSIILLLIGKRKRSRSAANECLHDIQQETSSSGTPASSQSG